MRKTLSWIVMLAAATALVPVSVAGAQDDGRKIVYARSTTGEDRPRFTEIFAMDADGTDAVALTDNLREDAYPALSPDGEHIAFSRRIKGQYDLFVMDLDGSDPVRLLRTGNADEVLPAWSPDGKRLVYTATTSLPDGGWQSDVYKIRLANGRFTRLTFTPKTKEFAPDWSPDGTEIAFTKQDYEREKYGIAAVAPDATGLRWVVINPLTKSGYTDVNPSWSPDSEWIAFSRDHGDDPYVDVYKVSRDGSEVVAVTTLSELAENPVWGEDDRIIFMHNEGIAVVPADGGEVEHLTPALTGVPYWWPDW